MAFRVIQARRLYQEIALQVWANIEKGALPVGARLPSERELAEQLKVSRPSVREALIALEVEGVVEVRPGAGVFCLCTGAALSVLRFQRGSSGDHARSHCH
jgi:GntR family transcriptional repressor for pyruvate dehydrogenase complex